MRKLLIRIWFLPSSLVENLDEKASKLRAKLGIKDEWDDDTSFVVFLVVFFSLVLYRLFT